MTRQVPEREAFLTSTPNVDRSSPEGNRDRVIAENTEYAQHREVRGYAYDEHRAADKEAADA